MIWDLPKMHRFKSVFKDSSDRFDKDDLMKKLKFFQPFLFFVASNVTHPGVHSDPLESELPISSHFLWIRGGSKRIPRGWEPPNSNSPLPLLRSCWQRVFHCFCMQFCFVGWEWRRAASWDPAVSLGSCCIYGLLVSIQLILKRKSEHAYLWTAPNFTSSFLAIVSIHIAGISKPYRRYIWWWRRYDGVQAWGQSTFGTEIQQQSYQFAYIDSLSKWKLTRVCPSWAWWIFSSATRQLYSIITPYAGKLIFELLLRILSVDFFLFLELYTSTCASTAK